MIPSDFSISTVHWAQKATDIRTVPFYARNPTTARCSHYRYEFWFSSTPCTKHIPLFFFLNIAYIGYPKKEFLMHWAYRVYNYGHVRDDKRTYGVCIHRFSSSRPHSILNRDFDSLRRSAFSFLSACSRASFDVYYTETNQKLSIAAISHTWLFPDSRFVNWLVVNLSTLCLDFFGFLSHSHRLPIDLALRGVHGRRAGRGGTTSERGHSPTKHHISWISIITSLITFHNQNHRQRRKNVRAYMYRPFYIRKSQLLLLPALDISQSFRKLRQRSARTVSSAGSHNVNNQSKKTRVKTRAIEARRRGTMNWWGPRAVSNKRVVGIYSYILFVFIHSSNYIIVDISLGLAALDEENIRVKELDQASMSRQMFSSFYGDMIASRQKRRVMDRGSVQKRENENLLLLA